MNNDYVKEGYASPTFLISIQMGAMEVALFDPELGLVTTWTKLLNFQTVWIVTTVFLCYVIAFFAISTSHCYFWTYITFCHLPIN